MSLFDLINQAQGGDGLNAFAKNFGINPSQAEAAMAALLPAFSEGLRRNAANPSGVAGFMQALSSGHHAQYFENMQAAMQPDAITDGNGILGHIFGSKDVSRAVASQAAANIGLGQETLKAMLPVIASMLMGGLHKQSMGQLNAAPASGGNIIGEIIGQMMRQAGDNARAGQETMERMQREATHQAEIQRQEKAAAEQRKRMGMDNPFGRALDEMFKQPPQGGASQQAPSGNPLEDLFRDMMTGKMSGQNPRQDQTAQPQAPQPKNPFEDAFGDMFRTGKKVQDDYQKGVESIFETYLDGMKRR